MNKTSINYLFKFLCIRIIGYKNINIIRMYLLRIFKNMPRYHLYTEALTQIEKKTCIGRKNSEVFFGYYDITPFDTTGQRTLCHVYNKKNKNKKEIYLGFAGTSPGSKQKINIFAKTQAWCWQMGARLQWFPSKCNNLVIYLYRYL